MGPNQLEELRKGIEVQFSDSQIIFDKFSDFFKEANQWEEKAKAIVVTDSTQVDLIDQAREARLALKEIRVNAEKTRKELKEKSLRESRAIDGIANVIKALIIPLEEHLDKQERFAEIQVEQRQERVYLDRVGQIQQYVDPSLYNLKEMSDEGFNQLLEDAKLAKQAREEAEKKVEVERIEKEKRDKEEQGRLRAENEKLRIEKEKEENERKNLQQELRRKNEEEEEEKMRLEALRLHQQEQEHKEQLRPEKEKIIDYVIRLQKLSEPDNLSEKGENIVRKIKINLEVLLDKVKIELENL